MKKIFGTLILIATLYSCGSKQTAGEEVAAPSSGNVVTLTDAQLKNAGVETGKLEIKNISSVLNLNGKVDVPPQNIVSVSVPLGGYLKATRLLPGMHVNKGDILAVMEDPQYIQLQQDYLTAKAQFAFNEKEYNRQKELNLSKASSDKVFEQAKATYQTQYILIKSLEQKLRLIGVNPDRITPDNISKSINIYSPITGFVSSVNVNIGKFVNPSDVLFELVNPEDIHLALTVFDKDVNKLSIGQKLIAYTNTHPEKKYPGDIILISKTLAGDNATLVHCHFEKYDKELLPGMFMNADVELKLSNVLTLPDESIVRFENKNYAFVEKSSHQFEMKELQVGNKENGFTEVTGDSSFNNQVFVVKGAYKLLMALKNVADE
ncbi:MAG: efflux RND transporter periplasmic adaptor subunit [Chitinophagaceae bacterium]|nr:efflux RND transporter periplasmic adaptor subunit [Chitinophagaceae bacterium]